jgi:hypothetical protein
MPATEQATQRFEHYELVTGQSYFYAMEFVEGETLEKLSNAPGGWR